MGRPQDPALFGGFRIPRAAHEILHNRYATGFERVSTLEHFRFQASLMAVMTLKVRVTPSCSLMEMYSPGLNRSSPNR